MANGEKPTGQEGLRDEAAKGVQALRAGHLVTPLIVTGGVGKEGGFASTILNRNGNNGFVSKINWDYQMDKFPQLPQVDYVESKIAELERYAGDILIIDDFGRYVSKKTDKDGKPISKINVKPLPRSVFVTLEDVVFKLHSLIEKKEDSKGEARNWFPFNGYKVKIKGDGVRVEEKQNELFQRYIATMTRKEESSRILPLPYAFSRDALEKGELDEDEIDHFYYALRYNDGSGVIPVLGGDGNANYLLNKFDHVLQGVNPESMPNLTFILLHSNEFRFVRECLYGVQSIVDMAESANDKRELAEISASKLRLSVMKSIDNKDASGIKARKMLEYAIAHNVSDLHFVPYIDNEEKGKPMCQINFRVDGHIRPFLSVPVDDGMQMINALMTATGQTQYKGARNVPCDADVRLDKFGFPGYIIRASTMPSFTITDPKHGESRPTETFSGRIAQITGEAMSLENLGLPKYLENDAKELVSRRDGITYFIGATNTGKTTTQYALIREADPKKNRILSIENPIERIIPGVAHTQLNAEYTLDKALKAMVRQDPDIIVVGEVRDYATADAAIQASLTGHLVFTTLHARTDFDAIKRLCGLAGTQASKDYLITMGMTLNCLWAQRLAAKLCPKCKVEEDGRDKFAEILGYDREEFSRIVPNSFPIYKSRGRLANGDICLDCKGYGDRGMQVVSQVLMMNPEIRDMIAQGIADEERYLSTARKMGMLTFPELATLYVRDGTISMDEASGVAPFWEMKARRDFIVERLVNYDPGWASVKENPFIFR